MRVAGKVVLVTGGAHGIGRALADGILTPEDVAGAVIEGLETETFLILPHPSVGEYIKRKTADYDRWLRGMRRFRRSVFPDDGEMRFEP